MLKSPLNNCFSDFVSQILFLVLIYVQTEIFYTFV